MDRRSFIAGSASIAAAAQISPLLAQDAPVEFSFFFPVAVGGAITKLIDGYAAAFGKENPDIKVTPVYSGTYQETLVKVMTAHKSGAPPALSVQQAIDLFTLIDEDAVTPVETFVKTDEDKVWLKSFFPGFMTNSQTGGKVWSIPFQRSTVVLYWNKDLFKQAGLDPEKAPTTWAEHTAFAEKLTRRDASGVVTQWGVQIPSTGFSHWLLQALAIQAGEELADATGEHTFFDKPGVQEALQYWVDLGSKYKVHPPGVVEWGTTPKDFFEGKTAMMWTTSGNLTNVRNSAKFPFGVAMLPAGKRQGSPTGGGNFHIAKKAPPAQQEAAFRFVKWVTQPERAAQWSIDTGYVAVSQDAYKTKVMTDYAAGFPAATVARDQLEFAVAGLATHENERVTKALSDNIQAALLGAKPVAAALRDAQAEAERILKPYR